MFTEKDLVFPMPKGNKSKYLNRVLDARSHYLETLKDAPNPIATAYAAYPELIKKHVPQEKIEGLAQIIREADGLSEAEQRQYVADIPFYVDGQVLCFGSLYNNGLPMHDGGKTIRFSNQEAIQIGDSLEGERLSFVLVTIADVPLFICDHNVICGISWTDLNKQCLILGKEVIIDEQKYLLRVLTGDKKNTFNEWDIMMLKAGRDNDLWHWNKARSWCQELPAEGLATQRGYYSATFDDTVNYNSRGVTFGWRPVLEKI